MGGRVSEARGPSREARSERSAEQTREPLDIVRTAPGGWRAALPCPSRFRSPTLTLLVFLGCSTALRNPLNRPMRTRMSGGVAGESGRTLPHADTRRAERPLNSSFRFAEHRGHHCPAGRSCEPDSLIRFEASSSVSNSREVATGAVVRRCREPGTRAARDGTRAGREPPRLRCAHDGRTISNACGRLPNMINKLVGVMALIGLLLALMGRYGLMS
jgi:hypothetical protein